jgi:hypothetical protein
MDEEKEAHSINLNKGSVDTTQNKSKTIDSEYQNIEVRDGNCTLHSMESEKLVLYVKKDKKKKSRRSSRQQETVKNRKKHKSRRDLEESEDLENRKTKDTSTERKTRILSKKQLVEKRQKLSLVMTKPVEIIVMNNDTTIKTTDETTENTINPDYLVSNKNLKSSTL